MESTQVRLGGMACRSSDAKALPGTRGSPTESPVDQGARGACARTSRDTGSSPRDAPCGDSCISGMDLFQTGRVGDNRIASLNAREMSFAHSMPAASTARQGRIRCEVSDRTVRASDRTTVERG